MTRVAEHPATQDGVRDTAHRNGADLLLDTLIDCGVDTIF